MTQEKGEYFIGVISLVSLGIPALFGIKTIAKNSLEDLKASRALLDLCASIGIFSLYVVGLLIVYLIIINLLVDVDLALHKLL